MNIPKEHKKIRGRSPDLEVERLIKCVECHIFSVFKHYKKLYMPYSMNDLKEEMVLLFFDQAS